MIFLQNKFGRGFWRNYPQRNSAEIQKIEETAVKFFNI